MLNPITISEGRQPRGVMKVNDVRVDAWIRFEVENNIFYEADSFRVTIALSALPIEFNAMWWSALVSTAISNYINTLPLGQSLPYSKLTQIAYEASPGVTNVTGVTLNGGTTDISATAKQVIKAGTGSVA